MESRGWMRLLENSRSRIVERERERERDWLHGDSFWQNWQTSLYSVTVAILDRDLWNSLPVIPIIPYFKSCTTWANGQLSSSRWMDQGLRRHFIILIFFPFLSVNFLKNIYDSRVDDSKKEEM